MDINRYIVECKAIRFIILFFAAVNINRYIVECKGEQNKVAGRKGYYINRYIVECKGVQLIDPSRAVFILIDT